MNKNVKHELRIMVFAFIALFMIHNSLFAIPVYAAENIGVSRITPASPFYFLKSVREILELKFAKTGQQKAVLQLKFLTSRIKEVNSLAKTSRQDLIEPTLESYLSGLNDLIGTAYLSDENMAAQVSGDIIVHMSALQTINGQVSNPAVQRSIRAAVFRLTQWDERLITELTKADQPVFSEQIMKSRLSGCSFLSKEASSSALNEVERAILSERGQKCLIPNQ